MPAADRAIFLISAAGGELLQPPIDFLKLAYYDTRYLPGIYVQLFPSIKKQKQNKRKKKKTKTKTTTTATATATAATTTTSSQLLPENS